MRHITIHVWITIGLPLYLVGFEFMLRHLFNVEISSFIGPSLGASGLGLLLECTKPKKINPTNAVNELMKSLPKEYEFIFRDKHDEKLVVISWVNILICSAIWVFVCSISIHPFTNKEINVYNSKLLWAIFFGTFNYIIGVVCLFSKEININRKIC